MDALPCSRLDSRIAKPLGIKHIGNPIALGEKIRNKRLEEGLLQKDVANLIGVSEDSVTYWEKKRSKPRICYYPKIIQFLGYFPFEIDTSKISGKILYYRYVKGITQRDLAKLIDLDITTIYQFENGKTPKGKSYTKLAGLLSTVGLPLP